MSPPDLASDLALDAPAEASAASPPLPLRLVEVVTVLGAGAYFALGPRSMLNDAFALCGTAALVALFAARGIIPPAPRGEPGWRPILPLLAVTAFVGIGGPIYGLITGVTPSGPVFARTLAVYALYGPLQQYPTQRYLVLRMQGVLRGASDLRVALATGALFGLLHLPFPGLILPSTLLGFLWSHAYLRGGRLWPVALSHVVIAVAFFLFVSGHDPFAGSLGALGR